MKCFSCVSVHHCTFICIPGNFININFILRFGLSFLHGALQCDARKVCKDDDLIYKLLLIFPLTF